MSWMSLDSLGILLGAACTLAIYSFLIKENLYYRLFEHIFVGLSVGYGLVVSYFEVIKPKVVEPLVGVEGHSAHADPNYLIIMYLLPGFLMYFIYSQKHNWLARIWIGFGMGIAGGAIFRGLMNGFLPQITSSFKPLWMPAWGQTAENIIFICTLLCVMVYFFFSIEHKKPGIKQSASMGRLLMMVGFGAIFGTTVMARMSLFIERAQFLYDDFGGLVCKVLGLA